MRLVYFHPPGILQYHDVVDRWMEQTGRLKADGRFRWYTMTDLAAFLNSRKQVKWSLSHEGRFMKLDATDPTNLEHFAWFLPERTFTRPTVVTGSATVTKHTDGWLIVAGPGTHIEIEAEAPSQ